MNRLVLLIGLLLGACIILSLSNTGILERFVFSESMFGEQSKSQDVCLETFTDSSLTPFIQDDQPYFNKAANLINPMNPQLPLSAATSQNFIKATISPDYESSLVSGTTTPLKIPSRQPEGVVVAQTICEKINTADCNAFDNPEFAANCGLALDIGTNTTGKAHTGGLYLDPMSRQTQKLNNLIINGKDYNTYSPTLGTSKMFTTDKDMCFRKQVDLKCKQGHVIGDGNASAVCSLCFTDGSYHATSTNTTSSPVTLSLYSNADNSLYFKISGKKGDIWTKFVFENTVLQTPASSIGAVDGTTYSLYTSPPLSIQEGDRILIVASNQSRTNARVAGFLSGMTASNSKYSIDITAFIDKDYDQPVLQNGTINSYFVFFQQEDKREDLNLNGMIPFTFTAPPNPDANNCMTGPFVTQAASMTALNADGDCYSSDNSPGNYPVACLQKIFRGVGGTMKGTGYPNKSNMGQLLRDRNGTPRTLGQITDYLSGLAVQAATGLNNGVSMTLVDWNNASMFMTGKAITNACETAGKGFVSQECINFLYTDPGTYGNSVQPNESLDSQNFQEPRVCRPEGALNPANPDGLLRAKAAAAKSGQDGVKLLYKTAFQTANNTSLGNSDRASALKDCYGATILKAKAEVFPVSNGTALAYNVAYNDAPALCAKLGAVVATKAQLSAAQAAGSQTCRCGWVADDQTSRYPMTQSGVPGCGSPNSEGLVECPKNQNWIGANAAVYCYGPKPDKGSAPPNITVGDWSTTVQTIFGDWASTWKPSNVTNKWSQYS